MSDNIIDMENGQPLPIDLQKSMDLFKEQLLIVLLNRLADANGVVTLPVDEVDGSGRFFVEMASTSGEFVFKVKKKQ